MKINPQTASIDSLLLAIGENLREHIKAKSTIQQFCQDNGVPSSTLYRFFDGDNISADNLFRIIRGLGMTDVLGELLRPPEASPVQAWRKEFTTKNASIKNKDIDLQGLLSTRTGKKRTP